MKHFACVLISFLIADAAAAQQNGIETSHYVFPEFTRGVVLMKAGERNEAMLNYNALTEEMIFDDNGRKRAITESEMLRVDTVYIGDGKFVGLNGEFVELVHHSTWDLFIGHKCKVEERGKPSGYGGTSQTSAATAVSSLYSQGRVVYNLKLPDEYQAKPYRIYLLRKNGEIKKFSSMRELRKLYQDDKDLYKEYVKANPMEYEDQERMIQFIQYLESNAKDQ